MESHWAPGISCTRHTFGDTAYIQVAPVRPQSVYRQAIADTTDHAKETLFAPLRPFEEKVFESSLRKRDTVIYFHGNVSNDSHLAINLADLPQACNRATPHRVQSCMAFSNKLDVFVCLSPHPDTAHLIFIHL